MAKYKQSYETKEWKDYDSKKLYMIQLKDLPRREYNAYSPREAVERYKSDLNLAMTRDSSEFTILEVQHYGKPS